jgi:hypothetical protein
VDVLALLVVLVLLAGTVMLLSGPLRASGRSRAGGEGSRAELAELEAAKEAKYREIRETELDFRTGKLSEADFRATDATLRAEAAELLRRIDELGVGVGVGEGR